MDFHKCKCVLRLTFRHFSGGGLRAGFRPCLRPSLRPGLSMHLKTCTWLGPAGADQCTLVVEKKFQGFQRLKKPSHASHGFS